MTNLLVLKERLKEFYSKNEVFITPTLKFLLAFVSLLAINSKLGYMTRVTNILIVLVVALMCSFLPFNFTIVISAGFVLLHFYALSLEITIVALAMFLIMFLLYFRFTPKHTIAVLLVPVCFFLKIPYIIPIAMGLLSTPLAIISVGCGTVIYYFISYVSLNDTVLGAIEGEAAVQKFRFAMDGILDNKTLIITLIAFSATIITVYVIRRLSIDHAWTVAIIAGTVTNGVILLIGDFIMDSAISILMIFISSAVCLGLATVLQFFTFNVDYSRTEKVQFEDDEYYYYVKAVPKITMSTPQKRVKKINSQRKI